MIMLIDTHSHVNFNAFREDSDEILKRTLENDIWVVMPGSQYSTSKRSVEIAERFREGVYAAIGIHPIHLEQRRVGVKETQSEIKEEPIRPLDKTRDRHAQGKNSWETFETRAEEFDYGKYKELARSKKVVAIGEIGLDYYYQPKNKTKREEFRRHQKEILQKQIDLAEELNLPVILHCRVAHRDLFEILDTRYKIRNTALHGVLHSFTGTVEQAQQFMDLGLYVGFNGLIFKDVATLPNPEEVISSIPLDHIVLETDSPYLVPPAAEKERNEPIFVKYIAEEVARIKKISLEQVAEATTQNAKSLFKIE